MQYMYASEHHFTGTDLKFTMRNAIRANRGLQATPLAKSVVDLVSNMWWNPRNAAQQKQCGAAGGGKGGGARQGGGGGSGKPGTPPGSPGGVVKKMGSPRSEGKREVKPTLRAAARIADGAR